MSKVKNWLSADTWDGRDTSRGDIWTDSMNNGDKLCALFILLLCFGIFVFVILDCWFDWSF